MPYSGTHLEAYPLTEQVKHKSYRWISGRAYIQHVRGPGHKPSTTKKAPNNNKQTIGGRFVSLEHKVPGRACWYISVIPAFWRQRQKNCSKFEASLKHNFRPLRKS